MNPEALLAIFRSVDDPAWEGSWQHRDDVTPILMDCGDSEHGELFTYRGHPAIVINHGAVLVPAVPPMVDTSTTRKGQHMRKLTADEVEFEESIEPEDLPVQGNYMCTDDPEADRAAEQELLERLAQGDESAWCRLVVTAKWRGYEAQSSLGSYVFPEYQSGTKNLEYAADDVEQLRYEALEFLNAHLEQVVKNASELQELLREAQE